MVAHQVFLQESISFSLLSQLHSCFNFLFYFPFPSTPMTTKDQENTKTQRLVLKLHLKQKEVNSLILLVGMQIGAATMKNSMEVPQTTKNSVAI